MTVDQLDAKKGALEHGFHRAFDLNYFTSHKTVSLSILEERVNQFITNVNAARERQPIDEKIKNLFVRRGRADRTPVSSQSDGADWDRRPHRAVWW